MTRLMRSFPEYRVVVPGRAVSFRSSQARAYKRSVRTAARGVFARPLTDQAIEVYIDYFHRTRRRFDMDNVAKCVLDALNGMAYVDDRQIQLQAAKAHFLQSPVKIYGGPVDLIKPLRKYEQYLFIRIRDMRGTLRGMRHRRASSLHSRSSITSP